jgi:hypothetical protein
MYGFASPLAGVCFHVADKCLLKFIRVQNGYNFIYGKQLPYGFKNQKISWHDFNNGGNLAQYGVT